MSGVISFGKTGEPTWGVAGWVFRRFLGQLKTAQPRNDRFEIVIDTAEALNGLHLLLTAEEDPGLADLLQQTIRTVAIGTLHRSPTVSDSWKEGLDETGQQMYLRAIRDLVEIVGESSSQGIPRQ